MIPSPKRDEPPKERQQIPPWVLLAVFVSICATVAFCGSQMLRAIIN